MLIRNPGADIDVHVKIMQKGCRIFSAPIYPCSSAPPLTGQKIPRFKWNSKVHYRALNSPLSVPVLCLINQRRHLTMFFYIHFNSIQPSCPSTLNGLSPSGFSTHNLSFFLSFCPSITPTHCRCRRLLLHFITFSDTHSVGLLWTRDRPVAEIYIWQQTAFTTDRHPCPQRNSKSQPQKASAQRPSPWSGIGILQYT